MSNNFEIIAGTYEEYVLGYVFNPTDKTLTQSFASHDHAASVRCLTTSGPYLASGGSDDRIIVYDLKTRKEHCMLTHHDSTVTALTFTTNNSHIISASHDGALAIVRCGNWQLEKQWEHAHKDGYILDIALHTSGKLALTLGSDATIHTWNLIKGRESFIINLKTKCKDSKSMEKIEFGPDESKFVIYGGKFTEIWSIKVGGVLQVIEHEEKVTSCTWLSDNQLFVGYETGQIGLVSLNTNKKKLVAAHDCRVKSAKVMSNYIITASSSGEIKIWTKKLKEIANVSTGCRITCLTTAACLGEIKKEEPEAVEVPKINRPKPVKRTVVVEYDEPKKKNKIKK